MTDLSNKELIEPFLDIYKLGYEQGYKDCKYHMELEALKRISKENIKEIVKNSTKPFDENSI